MQVVIQDNVHHVAVAQDGLIKAELFELSAYTCADKRASAGNALSLTASMLCETPPEDVFGDAQTNPAVYQKWVFLSHANRDRVIGTGGVVHCTMHAHAYTRSCALLCVAVRCVMLRSIVQRSG